jgi:hypothetical protein
MSNIVLDAFERHDCVGTAAYELHPKIQKHTL